MAEDQGDSEGGVLTRACITCGKEYFFTDYDPPAGMSCERCGGTVFRSFYTPTDGNEATEEFNDSSARDLDPDDAEGDTLPGDVLDLNSQ
jgi:predicted  nucleic acid-binding Zn-ribbon protein